MFFTLSRYPDQRLPLHRQAGQWVISHDQGWQIGAESMRKGLDINWTEIHFGIDIIIDHDHPRSYPLWWNRDSQVLTNFMGSGQLLWSDQRAAICRDGLSVETQDIFPTNDIGSSLSLYQCADQIIEILIDRMRLLPIGGPSKKLFVSGGVDTVLLFALVRSQNRDDIEILDFEHFEYDWFTNRHYPQLRTQHWAYAQIHHWREPTVLLTGASGDEFMMRGPSTLALWAAWHDIDLCAMLENSVGYHVGYFRQPKNFKVFAEYFQRRHEIKSEFVSKEDLVNQILNVNANDWQHWHLGETLTWTPFKDLSITQSVLSLDTQDFLQQILDARLNKIIIEKLWPPALGLISKTKNQKTRAELDILQLI